MHRRCRAPLYFAKASTEEMIEYSDAFVRRLFPLTSILSNHLFRDACNDLVLEALSKIQVLRCPPVWQVHGS